MLAEIEQHSGANLKVSPPKVFFPSTSERMILVSGELESISRVVNIVLGKLIEHGADPGGMTLHMTVPNSSIPAVIGKGGEIVRNIQARSGATVHLSDRVDGVPEILVELKGTDAAVVNACEDVVRIIQNDPRIKEVICEYYPVNAPPAVPPAMASSTPRPPVPPVRSSAPLPMDPASSPDLLMYPLTIEFVVPESSVSFIEGENRDYLDFVFAQTGAVVSVGGLATTSSGDVTVAIKGPLCGVQGAHILVIKKVTDAILAGGDVAR